MLKHKQKGNAALGLFFAALIVLSVCGWVSNLIKLTDCDFEAPYKCEVVHTIGVFIVPIGVFTGYMDFGK